MGRNRFRVTKKAAITRTMRIIWLGYYLKCVGRWADLPPDPEQVHSERVLEKG